VKNQGCPRGKFVKTELRQVTADRPAWAAERVPHVFLIVVLWQKNKYQLQKQCQLPEIWVVAEVYPIGSMRLVDLP